jgi:hypothetical protein
MAIKNFGRKSYMRTIEVDGYNLQQVNDLMDAEKIESFDGFVNEAISDYLLRVNNFGIRDKVSKIEKNEKHEKYNLDANDRDIQIWKNQEELRLDLEQYIPKYSDILKPFEEKLGHKITNLEKFLDYFVPIAWEELQNKDERNEKEIQDEWSNLPNYKNYL